MASKRELKKIINAITFDVVDECMYALDATDGSGEAILALLNDAIRFRNEAIDAINASRKSKETAQSLKKIAASLEDKTLDFIERLNKLA